MKLLIEGSAEEVISLLRSLGHDLEVQRFSDLPSEEDTLSNTESLSQWTAEILGEMHLARVTAKQLAAEVGWHEKYLSAVLNGHRTPRKAEQKLREALNRLKNVEA